MVERVAVDLQELVVGVETTVLDCGAIRVEATNEDAAGVGAVGREARPVADEEAHLVKVVHGDGVVEHLPRLVDKTCATLKTTLHCRPLAQFPAGIG